MICNFEYNLDKFNDIVATALTMELREQMLDNYKFKYKGKFCFGNHYWSKCKNLDNIHNDFLQILKKCNVSDIVKCYASLDIYHFSYIGEIIESQWLTDFEDFKDRMTNFNYTFEYDENFHFEDHSIIEIFEMLETVNKKWLDIGEHYTKITIANAKAVIVRALYNPKTLIGKIHINRLFDENF